MIFFPKFRIKEKWKVQTPNEKMLKMYIGSQLNVPYKYKSQSSQSYNAINQQTSELLKQYASGERDINLNEEDLIKDLIRAYHYSSNPKQCLEAEKLQYAINKKIAYSKEKIKRLQNIGSLNSILNNKKEMRNLTSQEFIIALKTLQNLSPQSRLRKNMEQRLKSHAQLKYKTMLEMHERDGIFEKEFNLSPKNIQKINSINNNITPPTPTPKKNTNTFVAFFATGIEKIKSNAKKLKHKITRFYYKHLATIAIGSIATTAVVGGKLANMVTEQSQSPYDAYYSNTPNNTSIESKQTTADFAQAAKHIKQSANKTTIQGDYYDTALEIHLKSKKAVQNLYNKIDSLSQKGKIVFSHGTNSKRYAHAFTMYQLIRPNSSEYKAIKNLLNGCSENVEKINQLVIDAGTKGQGVKPDNASIKTSNFDIAPKILQIQHIKNLQRI